MCMHMIVFTDVFSFYMDIMAVTYFLFGEKIGKDCLAEMKGDIWTAC